MGVWTWAPELLAADEHIQLELVAAARKLQEPRREPRGEGAEAGLRVAQRVSQDEAEDVAGHMVSKAAAQRNLPIEGAGAEDERVATGMALLGDAQDVLRQVLAVGIGGDDDRIGVLAQAGVDARLEGGALA